MSISKRVICPCLTRLGQRWIECRYADFAGCMESISLEELIMAVRRQSQGFSRGTSAFRGVTHHPSGATLAYSPQRRLITLLYY